MKKQFLEYWSELGWGDRLEWLFKKTGIKWLVKKINPNCNCDARQQQLNDFEIKITGGDYWIIVFDILFILKYSA